MKLKRVRLNAVHYKMFSWRTGCGKIFDENEKEETDESVTCKVCANSRVDDYDYLDEYDHFGVAIARETDRLYPYADGGMRNYTIRLFHLFGIEESVTVFASLPNDDMARRLGENLAIWRQDEFLHHPAPESVEVVA